MRPDGFGSLRLALLLLLTVPLVLGAESVGRAGVDGTAQFWMDTEAQKTVVIRIGAGALNRRSAPQELRIGLHVSGSDAAASVDLAVRVVGMEQFDFITPLDTSTRPAFSVQPPDAGASVVPYLLRWEEPTLDLTALCEPQQACEVSVTLETAQALPGPIFVAVVANVTGRPPDGCGDNPAFGPDATVDVVPL